MSKVKLNQIVALNSGKKSELDSVLTTAYHELQKPAPFNGLERTYHPKNDEDDEKLPSENQKVQLKVEEILNKCQKTWENVFDIVLTNDVGNCEAFADVVVDDKVVVSHIPVSTLIYLQKRLEDIKTLISKIPTLTLSDNWTQDNSSGLYSSDIVETVRTKKTQKPIVLFPATPEHPAQTQMITEDIAVGTWRVKKLSSAYPSSKINSLLEKVEKLKTAVVKAREEANSIQIDQKKAGKDILDFIFN